MKPVAFTRLRSSPIRTHRFLFIAGILLFLCYVVLVYDNSDDGSNPTPTPPSSSWRFMSLLRNSSILKVLSGDVTVKPLIDESIVLPRNLTVADFALSHASDMRNSTLSPDIIGYPHQICQCGKYKPPNRGDFQNNLSNITSTCSHEATEYGTGQRVRSYALFVHENEDLPRYVLPIEDNLRAHSVLFPDWITRIYSNISTVNPFVCGLVCKYETLFWCDIRNIPAMGDLSNMHGRTWRFLPLGDPTVDIVMSRDMDNTVFDRERAAVAQWLESDIPFHAMRDNPGMSVGMLAGMWGAKNYMLGPVFSKFLQTTLVETAKSNQLIETWDETILKKYVHDPYSSLLFLVHDSYYCKKFKDFKTLPFPTQRYEDQTVGEHYIKNVTRFTYNVPPCPVECRPSYGKHWVFC